MDTLEWRTVDKSTWGDGPWQAEPDKRQWPDPATGLPCLIKRNPGGALCGYVGVPESHPLYGQGYDTPDVEVHGGLTFADRCADETDPAQGICHLPGVGEPKHVWWFGFDCAHYRDLSPERTVLALTHGWPHEEDETYRTIAYVTREVTGLAAQLATGAREAPSEMDERLGKVDTRIP